MHCTIKIIQRIYLLAIYRYIHISIWVSTLVSIVRTVLCVCVCVHMLHFKAATANHARCNSESVVDFILFSHGFTIVLSMALLFSLPSTHSIGFEFTDAHILPSLSFPCRSDSNMPGVYGFLPPKCR